MSMQITEITLHPSNDGLVRAYVNIVFDNCFMSREISVSELRGEIVRVQMPAVKDFPTELIMNISIDGEVHSLRFIQKK